MINLVRTLGIVFLFATAGYAQTGQTTRYWDCCKPSCAWSGKASVSKPVLTCDRNQNALTDPNVKSGCDGGTAFACANNSPWAVDDNTAYGFAAVRINGGTEASWCCACYELTFTSTSIAGKKMIVQATNTGGDLGSNHFDLMIPGGGVGAFAQGCPAQYGSWNGGATYGGVSSRAGCDSLPAAVREGCYFRFDWFQGADNPSVSFQTVTCPSQLTAISGCIRH
ncbi:glycoside hydrolase family 45 protein [Hymenopellis radicata]|nr:glycoside hydrolase family 45 protein [Hymenopellis radicata]